MFLFKEMIYFTIAKNDCGYLIDSISNSYEVLRAKFPDEKIYKSDNLNKIYD